MLGHEDAEMLGVYKAVDPSTYGDVYPENPNQRIKELADLFGDLYCLFIDMRYIDARMVHFPPHKHQRIDVTKAAELGLTRDAVDMYQMIPYHPGYMHRFGREHTNWNFGSDGGELILGGESLGDLRGSEADWWHIAVDPFYALEHFSPFHHAKYRNPDVATRGWDDEDGPYMRPWYVTLSDCGNHGSVMVLDTKTYRMWLIDQLGGSTDPAFLDNDELRQPRETPNRNDLNQHGSRDAAEFLRDMITRFKSLEWIPGGLYGRPYGGEHDYHESFQKLYRECGWPDKFNPQLFDKKRLEGGEDFSYHAESPPPTAKELAYKPLEDLYSKLVEARQRFKEQIKLVDADYRLKHRMYKDEYGRKRLEGQKLNAEGYLSPDFEKRNNELRTLLDFLRGDLEAMRTRTGRYGGQGWSGISDEELRKLYEKAAKDDEIPTIEALLKDKNMQERIEREYREAKTAAAAVPAEAWEDMAASYAEWEGKPLPSFVRNSNRVTVLGTGKTVEDIRIVLDENLGLDELNRRILSVLDQHRDTEHDLDVTPIWRMDDGDVAMVEEPPNETQAAVTE